VTRRALHLLAGAAALLLAWGCASVPRDAGVADVSQAVAARTGHTLAWQPGQPIEPPTDAALDAALEGELTVDDAVRVALVDNRDLLATLEELGIARADLIAARTVRNPLFEGEYHFPNQRFTPYEVAITQTLVDLIQLPRRRALGEAEMAAARLRVTASVIGFASEVRADFYTLQAAQAALAQQQALTAAAEAAAQLTQRQHEAGNVSDLDLETEQARYEGAKLALARAELDELQARERLLADLGATRSMPLRLAAQAPPPGEAEAPVEQLEAAQESRLDVQLARAEVEAARRAGPVARSAAFDDLAAGVHVDREAGGEHSQGPIGTVPIPLFDRGLAARARAAAKLRQAEQRLHALTANARAEARAAHERVVEARARTAYLADVVLPRRQRILYLTQLEYDAMQRGAFDLLRARQELADAERERVLAIRDYWLARTDLEAAASGVAGFSVRAEPPAAARPTLARGNE
jgi:cobalt-zinc-cadmium efflux system outer membrane protein